MWVSFVDYTSDNDFKKYLRTLNYTLSHDVKINMMFVNKETARNTAIKMNATRTKLR